ncbi:MAG: SDR family oxidoreductase [Aldersonia sp.]|nr:SDR family oxidoreductase [Aldersonia sp.]
MAFARALVTGGAGFVGSHLCEQLLLVGTEVVCLDNFSTGRRANVAAFEPNPGFTMLEHDVTEPFPDLPPVDLVCHLASPASPVDYQRLGVATLRAGADGTAHALELATTEGARFLLASTSEVYGDPAVHPQREDYWGNVNPIGPRSVYDEAKRYAEALTMAYHRDLGTDVGIARIFNTYGPRMRPDDGRMIPNFIEQALAGEPLTVHGDGNQTRSICYVDDTVRGLIALAASDHIGPFNIGNPTELTVLETAELVRGVAGSGSALRHLDAVEDDPRRRCPEITRAREMLGWSPTVDPADGLRRTVDWFAGRERSELPIGV